MSKKWKKIVKESKDIDDLSARVVCVNAEGLILIMENGIFQVDMSMKTTDHLKQQLKENFLKKQTFFILKMA
jgi:hypothetical protein